MDVLYFGKTIYSSFCFKKIYSFKDLVCVTMLLSFVFLRAPSTGKRRFVVGNIHVLFNPNRGDIKLGQVRLLLDKAYKLSQEWGDIPVIIAGDLNSVPQCHI
ncbi:hypothetical protein GLYMA_07G091232v4 [Glycine max]|nr:hypothetical protein GLYMA_07G091232v4 [Glycine max]